MFRCILVDDKLNNLLINVSFDYADCKYTINNYNNKTLNFDKISVQITNGNGNKIFKFPYDINEIKFKVIPKDKSSYTSLWTCDYNNATDLTIPIENNTINFNNPMWNTVYNAVGSGDFILLYIKEATSSGDDSHNDPIVYNPISTIWNVKNDDIDWNKYVNCSVSFLSSEDYDPNLNDYLQKCNIPLNINVAVPSGSSLSSFRLDFWSNLEDITGSIPTPDKTLSFTETTVTLTSDMLNELDLSNDCYFRIYAECGSSPTPTKRIDIICNSQNVNFYPSVYENGSTTEIKLNADSGFYFPNTPRITYNTDVDTFSQDFIKIDDDEYKITLSHTFQNVSDKYKLNIENADVNPIVTDKTNFYQVYRPSDDDINSISSQLLQPITDGFIDLSQYIVDYFKLFVKTYSNTRKNVKLGGYTLTTQSDVIATNSIEFDLGNFEIKGNFKNDLDYNSTVIITLPFTNNIELDSKIVMNKSINLKCRIDYLKFTITYYVYCDNSLINTINGYCGYRLPYKHNSNDVITPPTEFFISDKIIISVYYDVLQNEVNIYDCDKYGLLSNETSFFSCKDVELKDIPTKKENELLQNILISGCYY